jgi:hypothetical protein
MKISNVKIESAENNWKDWFIADELEDKLKLSIFLDDNPAREFYIDSRFRRFRVSGVVNNNNVYDSFFKVYYLIYEGYPMEIRSTFGYVYFCGYETAIECIINR